MINCLEPVSPRATIYFALAWIILLLRQMIQNITSFTCWVILFDHTPHFYVCKYPCASDIRLSWVIWSYLREIEGRLYLLGGGYCLTSDRFRYGKSCNYTHGVVVLFFISFNISGKSNEKTWVLTEFMWYIYLFLFIGGPSYACPIAIQWS